MGASTDPPCLFDEDDFDEPPLGEVLELSLKLQDRPWRAVVVNAHGQQLFSQDLHGWSMARMVAGEDLTVTFRLGRPR